MIIIMIIYAIVLYLEWHYLTRHGRKRRTFFIVLGYAAATFISFEILYYVREQWQLKDLIETVFGPIQSLLKMES
ncbi:hypothetical protein [Paenibacillus sp. UNC451MF]|uniref:hypothetical protein n=1 Tax=Paenibacillus sp. UNC451MF TaxID=1449063 RepID=UPI000564558D|nr:hypothetical protein [Paenibacillus sp. UNC451MF]